MDIKDLRNKIDFADQRLLQAFEERMRVSEEIAAWKQEQGAPLWDPAREEAKLEAVAAQLPADLRGYGRRLYELLFQLSKEHQTETGLGTNAGPQTKTGSQVGANLGCEPSCGLLGQVLKHSYSPQIHKLLNENEGKSAADSSSEDASFDYDYKLFEVAPENLDDFLKNGSFRGLNVTIPYKKEVAKRCQVLSETARMLGSVNTVVRQDDGSLYGDNTDYFGFAYLLKKSGVDPHGKRAVVLGSGGASVTVCAVLRELGADVKVVSRKGPYHYGDPAAFADGQILVNTTPVGMYPENGQSPIDLRLLPQLEAVLDIVYNPARTALLLQAEDLGIPGFGGLAMLVAQAWKSRQIFLGRPVLSRSHTEQLVAEFTEQLAQKQIEQVVKQIDSDLQNLVFVGMAGSGKTTLGRLVAEKLGRPFFDSDEEFEKRTGRKPSDYIVSCGEDAFRKMESRVLEDLGKKSGAVIATGGGAVTRPENYPLLHQNGFIFWVQRSIDQLPIEDRPLSQNAGPAALYAEREPFYDQFADEVVENNGTVKEAVSAVMQKLGQAR